MKKFTTLTSKDLREHAIILVMMLGAVYNLFQKSSILRKLIRENPISIPSGLLFDLSDARNKARRNEPNLHAPLVFKQDSLVISHSAQKFLCNIDKLTKPSKSTIGPENGLPELGDLNPNEIIYQINADPITFGNALFALAYKTFEKDSKITIETFESILADLLTLGLDLNSRAIIKLSGERTTKGRTLSEIVSDLSSSQTNKNIDHKKIKEVKLVLEKYGANISN